MPRSVRSRLPIGILRAALSLSVLTAARPGSADTTPSLALEPAPAGDRGYSVERAGVHGHLLPSARVAFDYARAPLVLQNPAQEADPVVAHQAWIHVLGSFSVAHRFLIDVDVPFVMTQASGPLPASGSAAVRPSERAAFGDVRLGARVKIYGSPDDAAVKTELAVATWIWLPTASEGHTGDGSARVRAALVLEGSSRRLYWAFNGGARTRPSAALPGALPTRVGTALAFGLAGGFYADARRAIAIGAELTADLTASGGARLFDPRATTAHLLLTGHYRILGGPFEIGAAFGPAIGQGVGSAEYRGIGFVGFAPERAAPPPDKDGDDVPDKVDACLELAGVSSDDPLLHGCPAIPADGDGDAIPDVNDACPALAGEPTGARATHGCPKDEDTDNDGVLDVDDACPHERGERPPAGDGCPKRKGPSTRLVAQSIELSQQVQFETGTAVLRPESDTVLSEVARVLAEHPEVELIEVQGHTDETGTADLNRRLGFERASAVVAWLTARGVARDRLTARGYGADQPIADNTTEEGRRMNRRVAFRVLRAAPASPKVKKGGAR